MARKKQKFNLAELILVIVVFAIVAALMIPALQRAKNYSINDRCAYNLGKIGGAIRLYYQDFGTFPSDFPTPALSGMIHFQDSLLCPADKRPEAAVSYGLNAAIAGKKLSELPTPDVLIVAADSDVSLFDPAKGENPSARHVFSQNSAPRAITIRLDGSIK